MRDIKFRALKDDMSNCTFVYGNLIYVDGVPRIQEGNAFLFTTCLKGTEGQYTGIKDKNGKEIYEGDIVYFGNAKYSYQVFFDNGSFVLYHTKIYDWDDSPYRWGLLSRAYDLDLKKLGKIEVIGNIHENPELLQ